MSDPTRQLKSTAGDTRLLGVIFVLMGALNLFLVFNRRLALTRDGQVFAIVNTVVLIGPGVWYFMAAGLMKRLHTGAARFSIRIAIIQIVIVTASLLLAFLGHRDAQRFVTPACFAVFQLPALIALLITLRRAAHIINMLSRIGHAFEPIAVQPIAPPPIDNVREK